MSLEEKYERLKEIVAGLGKVVVAFSGGVDSTLLLKVSLDVLGRGNVMALVAVSETYPAEEVEQAKALALELGVDLRVTGTTEMEDAAFVANTTERCYYCKSHLFDETDRMAKEGGYMVVEGSNADDLRDFRPGRRAIAEHGVRSPLLEAGLAKDEVRLLSKRLGLPTHDKPSLACLASRIPYGTPVEKALLERIDRSERFIAGLGVRQVRVRAHGVLARVEVSPDDLSLVIGQREAVVEALREQGFTYVTIDLQGFRTGSMNEVL